MFKPIYTYIRMHVYVSIGICMRNMDGDKPGITRCRSKMSADEFGHRQRGRLFANWLKCREKQKEYKQDQVNGEKPPEIILIFNHAPQ